MGWMRGSLSMFACRSRHRLRAAAFRTGSQVTEKAWLTLHYFNR
jgi:hypothetical protein